MHYHNIQIILLIGKLPPKVANIINTANAKKIPIKFLMRVSSKSARI